MSPKVSSAMWPKKHIASTMVEMDNLDPISLDAGGISTSHGLIRGNYFSMITTVTGGEWDHHTMLG